MNVVIRDREPFELLNPAEVAAYLRSEGWKEVEHKPDRVSVWVAEAEGEALEILLPLRRTLGDYVLRMADAVGTLAAKENRSQLEVLADLQTAGSDVIRVRYRHAAATDGSIPLDQGEALVENAREMMLAGACAAVQPKAYYSRRRPEEANRFVRGLRMGQTERGSYILTVYSKVSPSLEPEQKGLFDDLDPPFERRAVIQLATALTALRAATDQALTAPSADVFQKVVRAGVSSNLCSAVVGMNGTETLPSDELRISFSYARARPVGSGVPREVIIPGDHVRLIEEAARLYRASAPPEETEIRGAVVQLKRDEPRGAASGPITVMAFIDGKPRRVQISLDEASHQLAMQAYERGAEIACTGDLVKQGVSWALLNPKGFSVTSGE
jgi:hypothetical protein